MIFLGLNKKEKEEEIKKYLEDNKNIDKVYIFHYKDHENYKLDIDIQYVEYEESIMYRTFYPLLESINKNSLVIFDEIMRTQQRKQLIYNNFRHYINQSYDKIVFQYFPFIEDKDDFMILLDIENRDKYSQIKNFEYDFLIDNEVYSKPIKFKINNINIDITEEEKEKYEQEKAFLFDNLGTKHPDTIANKLQLIVSKFKQNHLQDNKFYIARNKIKKENIDSYSDYQKKDYIILDFHYRRINFNDFLENTKMKKIECLNTRLGVDEHYISEFIKWKGRLDAFYEKTDLYRRERARSK